MKQQNTEFKHRDYDYLFKLVIIGNSGVGKSSILLRFADDQFSESYLTTIGVDFRFKTLDIEGKRVKLQIWDTAGQERFRTITNAYYKGSDAIIITYDTTNAQSFKDIDEFWLKEVENYSDKSAELVLLGNKCDLADEKQVNTEDVQMFCERKKMEFYETSAKTNEQVETAFKNLAKSLMNKKDEVLNEKRKKRKEKKRIYEKVSDNESDKSAAVQEPLTLANSNNQNDKQRKNNQPLSKKIVCCNN